MVIGGRITEANSIVEAISRVFDWFQEVIMRLRIRLINKFELAVVTFGSAAP